MRLRATAADGGEETDHAWGLVRAAVDGRLQLAKVTTAAVAWPPGGTHLIGVYCPDGHDRHAVMRTRAILRELGFTQELGRLCVFSDRLHIRMSSIMRCRNGETRDDASMALLLLSSEAACLVTQHKQIHDPAQPHGRNEARFLPRERFSPLP